MSNTPIHEQHTRAVQIRRTADALLSRTQQRVMGLLFEQPERSFFATEVIKLAGCGSGTVQRELARLCDCGLVQMSTRGKQKHYRANRNAPAFAPLQQLLGTLQSPWLPLQEALSRLPAQVQFASVQILPVANDSAPQAQWRLLLVAQDLKLTEVFTALHPAEATLNVRIEPCLFTPVEFQLLRQRHAPQLRSLMTDETVTLLGSAEAVSQTN